MGSGYPVAAVNGSRSTERNRKPAVAGIPLRAGVALSSRDRYAGRSKLRLNRVNRGRSALAAALSMPCVEAQEKSEPDRRRGHRGLPMAR
jgi:hypothetical protein